MEGSVNKRLAEFINSIEVPKADFATSIGVTRQQLDNWIHTGIKIPVPCLSNIAKVYIQLNARWLLCGEGPMTMTESMAANNYYNTAQVNPEFLKLIYEEQLKYAEMVLELAELKVKYFNLLSMASRKKENNRKT
ncbi:MAG TPA: hypothetical protein DCL77_14475 [Prolixibacteraceae bacterium]|jgi:hypothetical protein|nr:hypothetical protein [Prolixibacteraceae bacterium]